MALQLLPRIGADPAAWAREKPAGDHLPYVAQIDDHTILLRDGRLMQVIALDGLLFETADTVELNYRKALRDTMLQAIGSSRFALYHHVIRRRVEPELAGSFPDPFSAEIDRVWRRRLSAKRLFVNNLFLCLIRRPLQGRGGAADRVTRLFERGSTRDAELAAERRALDEASDAMLACSPHCYSGSTDRLD